MTVDDVVSIALRIEYTSMVLVTLLGFLPSLILSVPAGVLADKYDDVPGMELYNQTRLRI